MTRFISCLFFLIISLFPMVGNAEDGYKLVCDEPLFDFGIVDQSAVVTNVFTLRNDGNRTCSISYIHSACSCTKGTIDKRMIGPGETAQLTAVFRADRRKDLQKKYLRVIAAPDNTPALTLYLEGFVKPND